MTSEELHKTEESRWILNEYSKLTIKSKSKKDISRKIYSKEQLYVIECFMLFSRLLETCTQLEQIPIHLRRFDKKYFLDNDVGQADFIQYHLEVYVGKLFTIAELILSLTNEVFDLRLKTRQCNLKNILKNLKNEQTKKIISALSENLENWRLIRNDSVHRNRFNKEENFERLSIEEFFWMTSEKLNQKVEVDWIFVKPRHFVDYFLKQERKKKIDFIKKNNHGINKYIDFYLKSIFEELKKNKA
ncbi:MAG: hypothetical protein K9H64_21315 [Bacteroidales bacterium]|nr:hypothetical protein [Bacteroidales bacterium]MCF8458580.1 hypothetical protein [Bacteroidales bacterium]